MLFRSTNKLNLAQGSLLKTILKFPVKHPLVTGTALAIAGILALNKRLQETNRIGALAFGGAVKPIKSFDSEIKKAQDTTKALRENLELFRIQNTTTGIPGVSLTIKQFQELKEQVKTTYPEIIKLFNQTPVNKLTDTVAGIKAQFIAAGDAIDVATQKVYALLLGSNKAANASVMQNPAIKNITNIKEAVSTLLDMTGRQANRSGPDFISGLTQSFSAMDTAVASLTDKVGPTEALRQQFDAIGNSQLKNVKLTEMQKDELAKTNPHLASMLKTGDSIRTVYAKWRIALSGVKTDLEYLSEEQAGKLASYLSSVENYFTKISDVSSKQAQSGPFAALATAIDKYNKSQQASKVISDQVQATQQDSIKTKQKQIELIKKEADERKKALREQQDQADTQLQIQQEQLRYQDALATGDMAAAAQSQIVIQRLVGQSQTQAAEKAIDEEAQRKIDALQAQIDKAQSAIDTAAQK